MRERGREGGKDGGKDGGKEEEARKQRREGGNEKRIVFQFALYTGPGEMLGY